MVEVMDTVTASRNLVASAEALEHKVYASLPWGYRISQLLLTLASEALDLTGWGVQVFTVFLEEGVRDVPLDAKGKIDEGEAAKFGRNTFSTLRNMARGDAPDLLQEAYIKLLSSKHSVRGATFKGAKNYVTTLAVNAAKDFIRKNRRNQSLTDDEGTDMVVVDERHPDSYKNFGHEISPAKMNAIKRDLAKLPQFTPEVLEAVPIYIDLLADRVSRFKIINNGMLPIKVDYGAWMRKYNPYIEKALLKHLT